MHDLGQNQGNCSDAICDRDDGSRQETPLLRQREVKDSGFADRRYGLLNTYAP